MKPSCDASLQPPSPKIPQSFAVSGVGLLCTQLQSRIGWEGQQSWRNHRIRFFFNFPPPMEMSILSSLGLTGTIFLKSLGSSGIEETFFT